MGDKASLPSQLAKARVQADPAHRGLSPVERQVTRVTKTLQASPLTLWVTLELED